MYQLGKPDLGSWIVDYWTFPEALTIAIDALRI